MRLIKESGHTPTCGRAEIPSKPALPKCSATLLGISFWGCPEAIKGIRHAIRFDRESGISEKLRPQIFRWGMPQRRNAAPDGNGNGLRRYPLVETGRAGVYRHYLSGSLRWSGSRQGRTHAFDGRGWACSLAGAVFFDGRSSWICFGRGWDARAQEKISRVHLQRRSSRDRCHARSRRELESQGYSTQRCQREPYRRKVVCLG